MRVVIGHGSSGMPGVAQGGYVAGVVARLIPGAAEVRLRRPAPLERPLALERLADGSVELRDGETVLAEGRPAALDLEILRRVSEAEAVLGARDYPGHRRHLFPTCYCCGPERGDGLRIFPGPVEGGIVAAPWVPSPSVAGQASNVTPPPPRALGN